MLRAMWTLGSGVAAVGLTVEKSGQNFKTGGEPGRFEAVKSQGIDNTLDHSREASPPTLKAPTQPGQ